MLEELLAAIADAFPLQPLTPATFADSTGLWDTYIYKDELEAASQGRSWDMLDSGFVESHYSALAFMKPEPFAAVLPAYLVALIRAEEVMDHLPAFFLAELTRTAEWEERFDARAARLTDEQRAVVARTLQALAKSNVHAAYQAEIQAALASWQR